MEDTLQSSHNDGQSGQRKRARVTGMYQRKRALAACMPCRARKTKCDNIRPACGFCANHGAQCTYADTTTDHSSFDPASLAILERINHAVSLLETQSASLLSIQNRNFVSSGNPTGSQPDILIPQPSHGDRDLDDLDIDDDLFLDIPGFPATGNNCEAILKWPIFNNESLSDVKSFVMDTQHDEPPAASRTGPVTLGRGIQEEDFIFLSRRFLSYVHIKNPILDVSEFTRHVNNAAETGIRWDGPSCLVLVACALGCLSAPFPSMNGTHDSPSNATSVIANKETGMAYYLAAKKRIGLIEPSLLSVQCVFLCGVLEMYLMNTLQAWHCINQACVQLRNLLWIQENYQSSYFGQASQGTRHLAQRLYWSCMKSECELRCEIPLPPSGLSRFGFLYALPSPPTELVSPLPHPDVEDNTESARIVYQEEERSWFYYLAEISFRRMMNRAFASLGADGEASWVKDFQQIHIRHHALEEQIDLWCSHIPPQISLNESGGFGNELAHIVRNRAMACREWIHRPFLYYVIHQPSDDSFTAQAMPLAKECLDLCVQWQSMAQPLHRHHGTWYVARMSMTRALLLLAAARSRKIEMPQNWREAVDLALQTLQYWAKEARDLEKAASYLRILMDTVDS